MPSLITADKDPNFLNRLEARSRVVAPCDALDHVVRVAAVVQTPRPTIPIIDPVTGKDIAEQNTFVHPTPIQREPGYCVQTSRPAQPAKQTYTNRKGKTFETILLQVLCNLNSTSVCCVWRANDEIVA